MFLRQVFVNIVCMRKMVNHLYISRNMRKKLFYTNINNRYFSKLSTSVNIKELNSLDKDYKNESINDDEIQDVLMRIELKTKNRL